MTRVDFRKSRIWLFSLALLALGWGGCAAVPPAPEARVGALPNDAQTDFVVGQLAEQNRDWAQAAAAYRRALLADPDSLVLWRDLAEMLMQIDRAAQAVDEFRERLKNHQDNPEWVFLMGEIADAAGRTAEAEANYRRAVNSPHPTVDMLTALGAFLSGQDHTAQGRFFLDKALALDPHARRARLAAVETAIDHEEYTRARKLLEDALGVDPGDEEWLFRLGKVCQLQGQKATAAKNYQQLLADDPENADARRALVELYLEDRDYAQALPYLEAMLRSEPGDGLVKRNLGAAYYELDQWDKARPLLTELEEQHQADAMTHFMLGSIYRQRGLWRLAEQELTEVRHAPALRLDAGLELASVWIELHENEKAAELLEQLRPELDDQPQRLLRYALACLRLDKAEQAAGALQKALTLAPQDASLQFHLGRVFLAQKKIPAALATWQHAVQLDPKFAEAWNHLAYTCAENRLRLPEARGWALRAVKLEPGNGNYRDTLGWVYFQTAQYAPALDALQQALEAFRAHPEQIDPVVYDHLGDVYDKLNRSADALRAWQRALQLNPQDESLRGKIKRHEPAGK